MITSTNRQSVARPTCLHFSFSLSITSSSKDFTLSKSLRRLRRNDTFSSHGSRPMSLRPVGTPSLAYIVNQPMSSMMDLNCRCNVFRHNSALTLTQVADLRNATMSTYQDKKLSCCWETVRRESMPRIAEVDVEMTT